MSYQFRHRPGGPAATTYTQSPPVSRAVANQGVINRYVDAGNLAVARPGKMSWLRSLTLSDRHLLISDDGTAAAGLKGTKRLFSTSTRKDEANARLTAVHSPIRLGEAADPLTVTIPALAELPAPMRGQTLRKYEPQWIAPDVPIPNTQGESGPLRILPQLCNEAACAVSGQPNLTLKGSTLGDAQGQATQIQRLDLLARMKGVSNPNRKTMGDSFWKKQQWESLLRKIRTAVDEHEGDAPETKIEIPLDVVEAEGPSMNMRGVERLILSKRKDELSDFFQQVKGRRDVRIAELADYENQLNMNQADSTAERAREGADAHANPDYGEAYAITGGGAKEEGKGYWNYHWGGVIMKTSTDNITLENHASLQNPRAWDIRMYGQPRGVDGDLQSPKHGQSFHEQWKDEGFGTNPLTTRGGA